MKEGEENEKVGRMRLASEVKTCRLNLPVK